MTPNSRQLFKRMIWDCCGSRPPTPPDCRAIPGRFLLLPGGVRGLHVCVCVEPLESLQAAHPVLHQRRHWMCAGDIGGDAHRCTCLFLNFGT